jgi:hypothetical protein
VEREIGGMMSERTSGGMLRFFVFPGKGVGREGEYRER